MLVSTVSWCRVRKAGLLLVLVGAVCLCWSLQQAQAQRPRAKASSEVSVLTVTFEGLPRACAGAINDDVHTFTIVATTKQGSDRVSVPLVFSFENNVGHNYGDGQPIKRAKFINSYGQPVETLVQATDSNGSASIRVLSSDVATQGIKIKAKWRNPQGLEEEVGSIDCDFARPVSYRRFPNSTDPDEPEDTGWLFDFPSFDTPNRTTPAKVYMKFMVDPAKGDVDGNWKFVNGHDMLIFIDSVDVDPEAPAFSGNLADYATIISNREDGTTVITTSSDGAAQATAQAGPLIGDASIVWLGAKDQTVWDD